MYLWRSGNPHTTIIIQFTLLLIQFPTSTGPLTSIFALFILFLHTLWKIYFLQADLLPTYSDLSFWILRWFTTRDLCAFIAGFYICAIKISSQLPSLLSPGLFATPNRHLGMLGTFSNDSDMLPQSFAFYRPLRAFNNFFDNFSYPSSVSSVLEHIGIINVVLLWLSPSIFGTWNSNYGFWSCISF